MFWFRKFDVFLGHCKFKCDHRSPLTESDYVIDIRNECFGLECLTVSCGSAGLSRIIDYPLLTVTIWLALEMSVLV